MNPISFLLKLSLYLGLAILGLFALILKATFAAGSKYE